MKYKLLLQALACAAAVCPSVLAAGNPLFQNALWWFPTLQAQTPGSTAPQDAHKDLQAEIYKKMDAFSAFPTPTLAFITPDGIKRTLYCNPDPCTLGSGKLHENISGVEMGYPIIVIEKVLVDTLIELNGKNKEIKIKKWEGLTKEVLSKKAAYIIETIAKKSGDKKWSRAKNITNILVNRAKVEHEKWKAKNGDNNVETECSYVEIRDREFPGSYSYDLTPAGCVHSD